MDMTLIPSTSKWLSFRLCLQYMQDKQVLTRIHINKISFVFLLSSSTCRSLVQQNNTNCLWFTDNSSRIERIRTGTVFKKKTIHWYRSRRKQLALMCIKPYWACTIYTEILRIFDSYLILLLNIHIFVSDGSIFYCFMVVDNGHSTKIH